MPCRAPSPLLLNVAFQTIAVWRDLRQRHMVRIAAAISKQLLGSISHRDSEALASGRAQAAVRHLGARQPEIVRPPSQRVCDDHSCTVSTGAGVDEDVPLTDCSIGCCVKRP